jgi:hypothetical protein
MAILASDSGGSDYEYVPVPEGMHDAICYKLVDAGTNWNEYQGEKTKQHSVFIWWELPKTRTDDDRPMSVFKEYRLSLHEQAALRRDLQAWRNKIFEPKELEGFDLTAIIGVSCKISVGRTSGGKEKVTGVFCADGGPKKVPTENEQAIFDLEDYICEFTGKSSELSKKACDIFEELPFFVKWKIAGCDEPNKEQVEPCFEMQAALSKSASKPKAAVPAAPEVEDDFEDDVPF